MAVRTLIVGCDASGKSTMLGGIAERYGDHIIESTSTPESRRFKHANLDTLVDDDFIMARENIYLGLTADVLSDKSVQSIDFVGTDATLVTRLSHDVMRRCIGGNGLSDEEIIQLWRRDEEALGSALPEAIVLTHAPFSMIRDRIRSRQQAGNEDEKFWGFNSPFFLEAYQNRWKKMIRSLGRSGFNCIDINTSLHSTADALNIYDTIRPSKTTL